MRLLLAAVLAGTLAAACTTMPAAPDWAAEADCLRLNIEAANYADDLADYRTRQLPVILFESSDAMQAYDAATRRFRLAALRLGERVADYSDQTGLQPDYTASKNPAPAEAVAEGLIGAADACATEVLR